jgi:hypothetical protein
MTVAAEARLTRRFCVHRAAEAPSRGEVVDGLNFEDAALAFVEVRHLELAGEDVSLMVADCETGEQQCFRIDLATGEASPCD